MKFYPVPVSTKHERSSDPADSGKKVLPGVERFRSRLFSGLRISATKGINFFCCVQDLFQRSAFPTIRNVSLGENRDTGECAEGLVVLNMILPGMLLGANFKELQECWML